MAKKFKNATLNLFVDWSTAKAKRKNLIEKKQTFNTEVDALNVAIDAAKAEEDALEQQIINGIPGLEDILD